MLISVHFIFWLPVFLKTEYTVVNYNVFFFSFLDRLVSIFLVNSVTSWFEHWFLIWVAVMVKFGIFFLSGAKLIMKPTCCNRKAPGVWP